MGIEPEKFVSSVDDDFICSICTLVLEDPVRIAGCEHMFCGSCIDQWIKQNTICPVDRKTILVNDLIAPDRTVVNMLNKLKMKCEFESLGCVDGVQLERWNNHLNECDFNPANKCSCIGCGMTLIKRRAESHKCVEVLEIEMLKLKQENGELKSLKEKFKTENDELKRLNEKFETENSKLKLENCKQNRLIKELVDKNEEIQLKFDHFQNVYHLNKLKANIIKLSPLLKLTSKSALSNSQDFSIDQLTLEERTNTTSINKWLILCLLPSDLKNEVRLAAVLSTAIKFYAMIITKNDEAFWIRADKTTLMNQNLGKPLKIDTLSGLKIKTIEFGSEIVSDFYLMALNATGKLFTCSYLGNPLVNKMVRKPDRHYFKISTNLTGKTIVQMACGDLHVLSLTSDGQVFVWGDNRYGQLGINRRLAKLKLKNPKPKKLVILGLAKEQKTMAIACCEHSSFAVMDNGDVFAWGSNLYGQLGLGNEVDQTVAKRIESLAGFKIRRLDCGRLHVLALNDDGSMFAWGWNGYGQLGTGDTENRNKPVKVGPSGVKFVEVAACKSLNFLSSALSEDGRVWVWGRSNISPGSIATENVLLPKQVDSASINDAIAEYAVYQMSWKTMVIRE